MTTYITFAKNRALDHLYNRHHCQFNIDLTIELRRLIREEMSETPWHSVEDLAAIGRWAMDTLLNVHGRDLVCRVPRVASTPPRIRTNLEKLDEIERVMSLWPNTKK